MSLEDIENLLRSSRWKEADIATANYILRYTQRIKGDWIRLEDVDRIPCECINAVDQLWLSYSKGKFGFSVQQSIYQNIEKDIIVDLREELQRFVSKVLDGNSGKPSDKRIFFIFENLNQRLGWNKNFSELDTDIISIVPAGYFPCSIWCYLNNQKVNISMGDLVKMWGIRGIPGSMPRYLYALYSRLFTRIKICCNSVEELPLHTLESLKELSDLPVCELDGLKEIYNLSMIDESKTVNVLARDLVLAIKICGFAATRNENKRVLTGVNLTIQNDLLEFAATDGYRLSVVQIKIQNDFEYKQIKQTSTEKSKIIIPARAFQQLERILEIRKFESSISICFDKRQVVFKLGDQYLMSPTIDGVYPSYKECIPHQFSYRVEVNRLNFLSYVEQVSKLLPPENNNIKLSLDSSNQCLKFNDTDLAMKASLSGGDLDIVVNVNYLIEGIKIFSSHDLVMVLNSKESPVLLAPLSDHKILYLLMPLYLYENLPYYSEPTVVFNIEYRDNLIYISSTKTNTSFFINNDEDLRQVLSSRIQQGKIELTKSEFTRFYHQRVKDLKT